jgi:hypothetical protein
MSSRNRTWFGRAGCRDANAPATIRFQRKEHAKKDSHDADPADRCAAVAQAIGRRHHHYAQTTREPVSSKQTPDIEGDEPDPRHWRKTAVAASFPT